MTTTQLELPPAKKPLKVLHIVARLNVGGVAIYVIGLNAAMQSTECSSQLVCGVVGANEGDMRYLADRQGVEVTILPSLGREISPLRDLQTVYQLWRLIRRERPDVVNTHTAKAGFVGRIAAWLAGVPVRVHTFHGHVFSGYFSPTKTRLYIWLERLCARLSTRIITLSMALKTELATTYHITQPERIEVIELGFDLSQLSQITAHGIPNTESGLAFRIAHNIPVDAPLIGIVGRLVPVKNHDLFLRALALVNKSRPDVYAVLVGDGERRAELLELVRELNLAERVCFAGWITDLIPVYSALDVLVLSSVNEGLPVSLIEAMAAGVPVVSTAVGGVVDLLQNGQLGAIVATQNAAALASAILDTLSGLEQRTQAAREIALTRYAIEKSAATTEALYRHLLAQRRAN